MCQWQCPKLASTRVLVYILLYFVLPLRKKIKRGGSTVIWKWKWGYKSAPENDFPIEIGNSESAES